MLDYTETSNDLAAFTYIVGFYIFEYHTNFFVNIILFSEINRVSVNTPFPHDIAPKISLLFYKFILKH